MSLLSFRHLAIAFTLCLAHYVQADAVYNSANGHYYERIDTPFNFAEARADVASRSYSGYHGYLASVTSQAENDFIINNLGGSLIQNHWIGASKPAGAWRWLSGEVWSYTNWNPGEPSGDGSEVAYMGSGFPLGVWNDTNGNVDRRGYIAEYSGFDISGTLNLEGMVASGGSQDITFVFRPVNGNAPITQIVSVPANGVFTTSIIPPDFYALHIKGAKYLATNVNVDSTQGLVSNVQAILRAADADNNNRVDIGDFGVLVGAYGSVSGDSTGAYNVKADFNGDGKVDISDFALLITNYLSTGDN